MKPRERDAILGQLADELSAGAHVFVLLDGARDERVHPELRASGHPHLCLYKGQLPPELEQAAPWLVDLGPANSAWGEWLVEQGWGNRWGVFLVSHSPLKALSKHFRTLLMVKRENGQKLYFRFYDPHVLGLYLPTCSELELQLVFGPVDEFVLEGKGDEALIRLSRAEDGVLERHAFSLDEPSPAEASA